MKLKNKHWFDLNLILFNIFTCGTYNTVTLKKRVRLIFFNAIILLYLVLFLYNGLQHLFNVPRQPMDIQILLNAVIEISSFLSTAIIFLYLRRKKEVFPLNIIFNAIISLVLLLLILTEPNPDNLIIWLIPYAMVAIFSVGNKRGIYLNLLFFIFCLLTFFLPLPGFTVYQNDFIVKILTAYIIVSLISYVVDRIITDILVSYRTARLNMNKFKQQQTLFFYKLALEIKARLTQIHDNFDHYIQDTNLTKNISFLKNNNDKLSQIILNFLKAQKQEQKIIFNHNQVFNLSNFLSNKIEILKTTAYQKEITLMSNIEKKIFIRADPDAIDLIIENLIDNALKYTQSGGEIIVSLESEDHRVLFYIRDNGSGISRERLKTIFLPYSNIPDQFDNLKTPGMGLFILKNIISSLNGDISIESNEGRGTIITVELPHMESQDKIPEINNFKPDAAIISDPDGEDQSALSPASMNQFLPAADDVLDQLYSIVKQLHEKDKDFYVIYKKDVLKTLSTIPKPEVIYAYMMLEGMSNLQLFGDNQELELDQLSEYRLGNGSQVETSDFLCSSLDIENLFQKVESIIQFREARKEMEFNKIQSQIDKLFSYSTNEGNQSKTFEQVCSEYHISERELDVAKCLLNGLTNKEISENLFISVETVKTHVKSILKKCSINSRIEFIKLFSGYSLKDS